MYTALALSFRGPTIYERPIVLNQTSRKYDIEVLFKEVDLILHISVMHTWLNIIT